MPTIELTFNEDINVSVQIGDIIYFTVTNLNGVHNTAGAIVELGPVTAINVNVITVFYNAGTQLPDKGGEYIMFAKDRSVNMSSLLGYFAKCRIKNNSTEKAEMYSISVDVAESSK